MIRRLIEFVRGLRTDPRVLERLERLEEDSHSPRPLGEKIHQVDHRLDVLETELGEHIGKDLTGR